MLTDVGRPAQLAAAAARASADGTTGVRFSILHTPDQVLAAPDRAEGVAAAVRTAARSARLGRRNDAASGDDIERRRQLIFTSAGGVGCRLTTSASTEPTSGRDTAVTLVPPDRPGKAAWGRAVLNPGFIYESSRELEILLTFGTAPWRPTARDTRAATALARHLAHHAYLNGTGPILYLHLPAAPYAPDTGNGGEPGPGGDTHASCLRMSVALSDGSPERRLALLQAIAELANKWGLGLCVGDRRPGRGRGDWVRIRDFEPDRYDAVLDARFGRASEPVLAVRPVTVVGPAWVGTTTTILAVLAEQHVGILGISSTAAQEVEFLHLTVVVPGRAPTRRKAAATTHPLAAGLARITGADPATVESRLRRDPAGAHVTDHRLLLDRPYPVVLPDAGSRRYPLWMTWDLSLGSLDLDRALVFLEDGLRRRRVDFTMQYARTRQAANGHIRGRAKASLRLDPAVPVGGRLTALCAEVEADVRGRLVGLSGGDAGSVHLAVTRHEGWDGAWASLP